ncbi:degenerin deg-1-like [Paramuricea clavata]|nr:degenerin deg-1-like [Paramuricea clavata]
MEAFQDKNDTEEEKKPSSRDILVEFMGYTSVHGFGRLVEATTFVWRIFWILAILGASGIFTVEVMNLFKLYSSRPVQTSVSVAFEKQLNFPAVTICNLNMIKNSSVVMHLPDELIQRFLFSETGSYYDETTEKPKEVANITEKSSEAVNITEKPTAARRRKRREEPTEDG